MTKPRYTIYDTAQQKYLSQFHRPVDRLDAAVTNWTRSRERAMKFPGAKSARSVARWLDANSHGGCIILNARGNVV
jgi:hypothetical protein